MSTAKPRTTRTRLKPPRRDGERRTAIVRRATEIFKAKGFAHTTIEDIAEAVGVTREAIYYYFRDKAEILIEIIKPESDYLVWGLERILSLETCSREKLVMAVESHMMRRPLSLMHRATHMEPDQRHDPDGLCCAVLQTRRPRPRLPRRACWGPLPGGGRCRPAASLAPPPGCPPCCRR